MYVVAGGAMAPARIIENFLGQPVDQISFSSPVRIVGFTQLPAVGALFRSCASREEAKSLCGKVTTHQDNHTTTDVKADKLVVPIVVKSDVLGTAEAVVGQIDGISNDRDTIKPKVIYMGVGAISENDVLLATGKQKAIILGFNVKVDPSAQRRAEREGVAVATFKIIYELTEWLQKEMTARAPKITTEEVSGRAKILRSFSRARDKQVVGGEVVDGALTKGADFKILRRGADIGRGKIAGLQQQKVAAGKVGAGNQFGMQVESRTELAAGDIIEVFELVTR
jgi:translation initiation factor IF-2